MKEQLIFKAFMEGVCHKFGIADAIAPLSKGFDTFCESEDGTRTGWASEYGDGGIYTGESSADGFFATPKDPIGYAILNNDVETLKRLHDGTYSTEEPWNTSGFSEDFDHEGQFNYEFMHGYENEFEKDWHRVVSTTDNQEALRLMLSYVPEFWLCSADFLNAFRAGYDKKLLAQLLSNYPNPDDEYNNYLPWDGVTIPEVLAFLEKDEGSVAPLRESVEDSGVEPVEIDNFPSLLASHLEAGTIRDYVIADGKTAIDDLKALDAFMTENGFGKVGNFDFDSETTINWHPAFGDATGTVHAVCYPGVWEPLAPKYEAYFAKTETPADNFYESASGASKSKWLRRIYNVAEPFTSHVYRDDNWSNVMDLFKTLREQVPEVKFTFGVTDGGYCCPGEDGMPRRKTYDVKATTPEGFDLVGSLHCDAAGSVEDPFDQYDMTLVLN